MPNTQNTERRPRFVTAKAVAQVYNLHPESIRRMARQDRIEAVRIGGRWRFPRHIIEYDTEEEKSPPLAGG